VEPVKLSRCAPALYCSVKLSLDPGSPSGYCSVHFSNAVFFFCLLYIKAKAPRMTKTMTTTTMIIVVVSLPPPEEEPAAPLLFAPFAEVGNSEGCDCVGKAVPPRELAPPHGIAEGLGEENGTAEDEKEAPAGVSVGERRRD